MNSRNRNSINKNGGTCAPPHCYHLGSHGVNQYRTPATLSVATIKLIIATTNKKGCNLFGVIPVTDDLIVVIPNDTKMMNTIIVNFPKVGGSTYHPRTLGKRTLIEKSIAAKQSMLNTPPDNTFEGKAPAICSAFFHSAMGTNLNSSFPVAERTTCWPSAVIAGRPKPLHNLRTPPGHPRQNCQRGNDAAAGGVAEMSTLVRPPFAGRNSANSTLAIISIASNRLTFMIALSLGFNTHSFENCLCARKQLRHTICSQKNSVV